MPNYSGIWTITQQMQTAGGPALWPGVASPGEQIYTGGGTYTWVCPVGVFSVSVVCVGGGGGGDVSSTNPGNNNAVRGAGGGGLGWKNGIPVTPGNSYTVQVGGTGSTSFFIGTGTVSGAGGQNSLSGGAGGGFTGDGGGAGGAGGAGVNPISPTIGNPGTYIQFGGGGGAGGYSGNGGAGGNASNGAGSAGSGGGGGGGGAWTNAGYSVTTGYGSSSGGGVGLYGLGSNGTAGAGATGTGNDQPPTPGGGGSSGSNGAVGGGGGNPYGANGGSYGGGASPGGYIGGTGGSGAVRIIWEGQASTLPRSFPNNAPAWSLYTGVLAPETTYTLTSAASVNEGSSVTFTAGGSNITNGTYYWTVTSSGNFGTSSGAFTITSNRGSFSVTPTADATTEGPQTFTASIRSGSISGTVLKTSSSVTINDTSITTVSLIHTLNNPNAYDTITNDYFGSSVAISGNYAIVAANGEDDAGGTNSGKAYIFNVTTGALLHTLNNPNAYGTATDDYFGSVGISDNYAIVGVSQEDDVAGGTSSGKAYIFNVTTGALVHTLNNPNPVDRGTADYFGTSVAISGNSAIVSASGEDDTGDNNSGNDSGKAYIYNVTTGDRVHTLNNPNAFGTSNGDEFGWSVAISGNYAIVGAPQEDDAGSIPITVNASVPTNGTTGLTSLFDGNSDDSFVTVSLPFNIQFLGLTYNQLFAGSNGYITFGAGSTTRPSAGSGNGPPYPHLGFFKGDKRLLTLHGGVVDAGVYTLRWEGYNYGGSSSNRTIVEMRWFQNSNAHQVRYITNANGATNLELGNGSTTEPVANVSVSTLQGYDIIALSASGSSGKAYIFNVTTGALVYTLNNPNAYSTSVGDSFGRSVAISGNYVIVGARYEDDAGGTDSGKVYIYQLS